ncbi:MAG TPA: LON peptidase substrate-binding domain-containing protein [Candidatus Limnocylindrales bacterium]|jgi:Lon protease-like protein|nr:LON peptidase substrate-binding domain-containing protein [Candidatus Limnocylindrales bacterium]
MQIPLFPLHTVLAPGIALPLHIFEERYRAMVRRCLDTSSPFGIVLIREGSEVAPRDGRTQELSISVVGTFAEIREASKYVDGRWDLLTVGTGRFVVREVIADREPYLVGEVDELGDSVGDEEAAEALVGRVTRRFVDYLRLLQPRDGEEAEPIDVQVEVDVPDDDDDEEPEVVETPGGGPTELAAALHIPDDPSQLSFLLTGIVQVDPATRQTLLEADSAEDRLRELDRLLDRELNLLDKRLAPYQADRRVLSQSAN